MAGEMFREKALKRAFSHEEAEEQFTLLPSKASYAFLWFTALIILFFVWLFFGEIPLRFEGKALLLNKNEILYVTSNKDGVIQELPYSPGQIVQKGDLIVELDGRKDQIQLKYSLKQINEWRAYQEQLNIKSPEKKNIIEILNKQIEVEKERQSILESNISKNKIYAPISGNVVEVFAQKNQSILDGSLIMSIMPLEVKISDNVFYGYISSDVKESIPLGTEVQIQLYSVDPQKYGYIVGKISDISSRPETKANLTKRLHNEGLANYLLMQFPLTTEIIIEPILDPSTPSGYQWSSGNGPSTEIPYWTISNIRGFIKYEKPIVRIFPVWLFESGWKKIKDFFGEEKTPSIQNTEVKS